MVRTFDNVSRVAGKVFDVGGSNYSYRCNTIGEISLIDNRTSDDYFVAKHTGTTTVIEELKIVRINDSFYTFAKSILTNEFSVYRSKFIESELGVQLITEHLHTLPEILTLAPHMIPCAGGNRIVVTGFSMEDVMTYSIQDDYVKLIGTSPRTEDLKKGWIHSIENENNLLHFHLFKD